MKASKLMLGDWVMMNSGPARVFKLSEDEIIFYDKFGSGISCGCDGIPLTTEMLEKNGFEHKRYEDAEYYCITTDFYDITIEELSDSIWLARYDCTEIDMPFEQVACSYVHQLQHFLRLVAMDELADNFKV